MKSPPLNIGDHHQQSLDVNHEGMFYIFNTIRILQN